MDGQILVAKGLTGDSTMPGSGATVTLWASNTNLATNYTQAARIKRVIVDVYSSAASAASGLQFDESTDGTNWRNLVSFSISATTYTKNIVSMSAPYLRVRYVNSANVLTTWEISVFTDQVERASQ